jgi:hypothetical protein
MPELMVAMTTLFVVSTFIMSMFVTGMRQTAQATQNQDLETLTRQELGKLRAMPYTSLDAEGGTHPFPAPLDDYEYTVDFRTIPGESLADARICDVTVSHPSYGQRTGRVFRANANIDPGRAAWEKFDCGTCHFLPNAGLQDQGVGVQISLGPIPTTAGADGPRPIPPGPTGLEDYIKQSITQPDLYMAYDDQGNMQNFYVENEPSPAVGDPPFEPDSTDPFIAQNSMSEAERDAIAAWIVQMQ